jgi:UDP-N-acetylmuramoyl-L-alanyl-D-glutamate--2,6-diaminopimelate ligase
MKPLSELLYKAGTEATHGDMHILIHTVCFSSSAVSNGSLFVAIKGATADGHLFIQQAIENGAVAIVCEKLPDQLKEGVSYVQVKSSALALAMIAANFFEHPSEKLKLIGVTGTNGKTTTATLLYRLFSASGIKAGLISTVKNCIAGDCSVSTHTTPDPVSINRLLMQMLDAGCQYCFMEVSSHAVVQHRIDGLHFSGGIFTNITHDHLDYHKTFDNYLKAKKGFFDRLPSEAFALVNEDDRNSKVMIQNCKARVKSFGLKSMADFKGKIIENSFTGLQLTIDGFDVSCRLIGSFNAYNLLGIYAAAVLSGFDKEEALKQVSLLEPVEGRFDLITSSGKITGIVDYAHTPDALENVLNTINDIRTGNEQLITVVGCGGNRDAAKRPLMASVAVEKSDRVILTSDNPRNEDPLEIIRQMQAGVSPQLYRKTLVVPDRREAIKTACALAQTGDLILLAGKGHETYQEIKGTRFPFDDKQVLMEMLNQLTTP